MNDGNHEAAAVSGQPIRAVAPSLALHRLLSKSARLRRPGFLGRRHVADRAPWLSFLLPRSRKPGAR